ncbi:MAG: hypothetical protein F4069_03825 [Rhodothermaceae bacterium]|nr:hypothetical protein [Rhodothermaceae bacterium]MYG70307.1 hypothetical protein [Rhodothermaceae bacterium]MYJ44443.1 hypothetical protein [Rhodothermaceae bacterium]
MDALYWISLIVGGVFVLLSLIGGGDSDLDADLDADLDVDLDADLNADMDSDVGVAWVDLFSVRTIFLFAAFFGMCGVLLPFANVNEIVRLFASLGVGLTVGIGGNYMIKRIGYAHISSEVTASDLTGRTAKVIIPFGRSDVGKIVLVTKGQRMQFKARGFEEAEEVFVQGEEVVVVRMEGAVAEVLKP